MFCDLLTAIELRRAYASIIRNGGIEVMPAKNEILRACPKFAPSTLN
jgi:hypothetical protein